MKFGRTTWIPLDPPSFGSVELVDAKLPDRKRLQNRAFATVVAPNKQIELRKLVNLLADAFEIAQCQLSDHVRPPFLQDLGT